MLSSLTQSHRRFFLSLPRDYVHRRRAIRRITTVLLVIFFSVAASYVILHFSGPGGFTPPHH